MKNNTEIMTLNRQCICSLRENLSVQVQILGIWRTQDINKARSKLKGKLLTEIDSVWVQIIKDRYLMNGNFFEVKKSTKFFLNLETYPKP